MTAFLTRLVVSIVLGFVVLVVVRWTGPAQISRPNERFHSNIESNNQKNTRRLIDSDVALLLSLHAAEKHLNQSHSPSIANDKPVKADVLWGDFIDAQKASGCIASNSHSSARVSSLDTRGLRRCRSKPSSSRILAENCMEEMDAAFLRKWRYNNDSDSDTQCEREASSKITCYTSPNKSKLCVFQNAMVQSFDTNEAETVLFSHYSAVDRFSKDASTCSRGWNCLAAVGTRLHRRRLRIHRQGRDRGILPAIQARHRGTV